MITSVKSDKEEINFNNPQLLKDKNSELVIVTNGKHRDTKDGHLIEGTILNSNLNGDKVGTFKNYWRGDIWEKLKGSVTVYSSDND